LHNDGDHLSFAGIAGALAFFIAYLVLKLKTDRNHDNLTNEELDWKQQLGTCQR
jgi:hypothetical protein